MDKFQTLNVALVHDLDGSNHCRHGSYYEDDADKSRLASMLVNGWDTAKGGVGIVRPMTDAEIEVAKEERKARHQALKDAVREDTKVRIGDADIKVSAVEELKAWENLYAPKGSILAPKYARVTAFRRGGVIPLVNAAIVKAASDDLEIITELPVMIKVYASGPEGQLAMISDNLKENEGKDENFRRLGNHERLKAALDMRRNGAVQNDFRKAFKAGKGQDFWWMTELFEVFKPHLQISKKLLNGDLEFKTYKWKPCKELIERNASDADVMAYVKEPRKDNAPAKQGASTRDTKARASSHGVFFVRFVLGKQADNDLDALNILNAKADEINEGIQAVLEAAGLTDLPGMIYIKDEETEKVD